MTTPSSPWELRVRRDDLSATQREPLDVPVCEPGQVVLRVDRVGVTANNVTYAALGDSFRYWEFFPAPEGWGIVPLWGFADVVESRVDGVEVGQRFYGYYPSATHLLATPGRVDERGFRDDAPHRQGLPSPYNTYALTSADAAYDTATEDLLVLYRALFLTSLMCADWLLERDAFGAAQLVVTSASSKTAYLVALCLRWLEARRETVRPLRLVGLTSERNRDFTAGLGLYDDVVTYDDLDAIDASHPGVLADFLGDPDTSARVSARLGDSLRHSVVVGITSQQTSGAGSLAGIGGDDVFFAPTQVRHRIDDWGLPAVDAFLADGWNHALTRLPEWVDITTSHGVDGLDRVWHDVLAGRSTPRTGNIVVM